MSDKIEIKPSKELKIVVEESLDVNVYNHASNLLPPKSPAVEVPTTTSAAPLPTIPSTPPIYIHRQFPATSLISSLKLRDYPWQRQTSTSPHLPSKYAETYELDKFQENCMIIFNHDVFFDGPSRPGTGEDEKFLRSTLTRFKFKGNTYDNLEKRQLIDKVKHFALTTDFSRYGCVCVAIMTHGNDKPGYLEAYDRRYNEYEIFEHFDASKNRTLAAKPIIFIIQACRGAQPSPRVSTGVQPQGPMHQLDHGEEREDYHLPMDADRIVFHSAYVGRASVRHPERGSWFIQTLCKKINDYALSYDLETIFRLVRKAVALDSAEWVNESLDWKQMPVVTSTLIREIYLYSFGQVRQNDSSTDKTDHPVVHLNSSQRTESPTPICPNVQTDTTSDVSPMLPIQPLHMPCSCFLEYFEYLKRCLSSFVSHNPDDIVAKNLLKMVERVGEGAEYNLQKFDFMQSVWEHFENNMHKFPPDSSTFVHRLYH